MFWDKVHTDAHISSLSKEKKELKNQCLKSSQQSDKRNYGEQCSPFQTVTGKISCM